MKTVYFADLHGNYNLWTTIKNYYGLKDTPSSNEIAVLNLDTLQIKYFKENKNE